MSQGGEVIRAEIGFTKEEADELISIIDRDLKQEGLARAPISLYFFNKISAPFKAKPITDKKEENQNGN